jgi:hypothetical protein
MRRVEARLTQGTFYITVIIVWHGDPYAKYNILIGPWAVGKLQYAPLTDPIVWTAKMDCSRTNI